MHCPVCESSTCGDFPTIDARRYWRCAACEATFLGREHHPCRDRELAEYRRHRNVVDDPRYRAFLARLADPLLQRLAAPAEGLDYGCGPGPALACMLRAAGHAVALYDPFFHPDASALARQYDFITCTEVVEHFHFPAAEFRRLDGLLRPGGWLAVMTCFQTDDARFAQWNYRRDPTHVVFYRQQTLRHVAARLAWECEFPARDVALLRKRR